MVFKNHCDLLVSHILKNTRFTTLGVKLTLSSLVFWRSSLEAEGIGDLLLVDMFSTLMDGDLENNLSFYVCKMLCLPFLTTILEFKPMNEKEWDYQNEAQLNLHIKGPPAWVENLRGGPAKNKGANVLLKN